MHQAQNKKQAIGIILLERYIASSVAFPRFRIADQAPEGRYKPAFRTVNQANFDLIKALRSVIMAGPTGGIVSSY
jgi:hypothetical protein